MITWELIRKKGSNASIEGALCGFKIQLLNFLRITLGQLLEAPNLVWQKLANPNVMPWEIHGS